jgi:glycine C-acetyltransferase/8-amino-7-oxononanoate synthase
VAQARHGLRGLGWELEDTPSPILCLDRRDGLDLTRIRTELFEQGIAIEYSHSYPSAPAGGGLRIAIFATHTAEQIDRLISGISGLVK